jgi:hypothetical protein
MIPMSEASKIQEEKHSHSSERRGALDVCPICGSSVHPEAYFCSRCSNYFCFVCRARVAPSELALQCGNRECDYFGKLVCNHCDPSTTVAEEPFLYKEPIDGYWPAWLLISLLLSVVVVWRTTWIAGGLAFLSLYVGLGYLLQSVGFNLFGVERNVELPRSSTSHRCLRCGQNAKPVSLSKKS